MKITLKRVDFQEDYTIGKMYIDGIFFCFTLEDKDRQLEDGGIKIAHETAIPRGIYQVVIDMSTRFAKKLPHILNVPQFEGIRIHSGNSSKDTEGCILLGQKPEGNCIYNSRMTLIQFQNELQVALDAKEEVFIQVS